MLAPPGYAKIVSTPSRSRHATRISLPDIAGPRSALWAAGFFAISVVLLISFLAVLWLAPVVSQGGQSRVHKKTHDRLRQPWVFVENRFNLDKPLRWRRLRRQPAE